MLACALAAALCACTRTGSELVLSGPTMGTAYTIRVARAPREPAAHVVRAIIEEELQRIDKSMSGYRADSEISRFNAAKTTEWFTVSPELAQVVAAALDVSERSGGAFDVTIAPLVRAWGFGAEGALPSLPDEATLETLRARIGHAKLRVRQQPAALRKQVPALTIDLNAIAPGFAVDRLAARFDALGFAHYMIDIGGEIRMRGLNRSGEKWRIAVERPIDAQPTPFAILAVTDAAVATSGEYRRSATREGRRVSHTIDPRTEQPIAHGLASVVVVHPEAMYADAWATAFNVLGAEEGYALALRESLPVMFIERRGEALSTQMTPAFEPYVVEKAIGDGG